MIRKFRSVYCVLAMLACASVSADDVLHADTIIVTATRTEIPLRDATVPVSVITREDIELSLATDLAELLRFEAGVDIGRNGGPGQATSLFLRGTESNHTLVLVDGVRINPGTLGGAAIQHVAPEVIERIEIVKGARSSLFGTDAIGGVINIITRRADSAYVEGGVGAGSFDSRTGFVSGGDRGEGYEFGATVNWQATDGYAQRTDSDVRRGYDNVSANLYAQRTFGNTDVGLRHWHAEGNVEYLDFFLTPVDQDYENGVTALELTTRWSDAGNSKLVLSHMSDDIRQVQSPDFVESSRFSVDWQYSHAFDRHTFTAGLYAVEENAETLSFGSGFDEDTTTRAVFVQDQWSRGRHTAFIALRLTDHDAFGNHTTWNAEYAFEINENWTLNAGIGHAMRAPDATDRFGFGGNPNLDPELADEAQLGLRFAPGGRHSVDFELYANNVEDLIEFDFETFTLANIDEAEIRGGQLGYEYRADAFSVRLDLVRQRADNKLTGERLLRRAEETATLKYTRNIGKHRLGISVLASGDRVDFGNVSLPGYVLTNLSGQFALGEHLQAHARIENLLDTEYQTAANYRMQERSVFVELKYAWR
ncbi:MAG: TonB-dependent receptor [Woeseiaceae bacterium]|nr:TonB-dependent receptor [Woeseiaceae bacterium]